MHASPANEYVNWADNPMRDRTRVAVPVTDEVRRFHRTLPGYDPTQLIELPGFAEELGVSKVFAKDESNRFSLPAFKALGASWAIHRCLEAHKGSDRQLTFVTATDGNHGRAVAHFAARLGHSAEIFIPDDVSPTAVQAIEDEGAKVSVISGPYDDVVGAAARHTQEGAGPEVRILVQDTAWDGYEEVPGWIVAGYSTLFEELDEQLAENGAAPDLVVVPSGVGSLLQAAITHYRSDPARIDTKVLSVEPVDAACVLASVKAGEPTSVATGHTVMAGLNCGTVSSLAWPSIKDGLDAAVAITDTDALTATRDLADVGVDAGPCGAAGLAAARAALAPDDHGEVERRRSLLGLTPEATVVLLITEGVEANPLPDASSREPVSSG